MNAFAMGFAEIASLEIMLLLFMGVVMGIIFGGTPGISTSMGIALMLPITFQMPMMHAIATILGLYVGGTSGGLITAILINIPGTSSAIATCWDGHPMAKNGQAGKALGIGILYSFLGGIFSLLVLFFLAPVLARFALRFGAIEYLAITVFSLTLIASVSGKSLAKGIIAATLGIMMTTVGIAPVDTMVRRYTFGSSQLYGGFQLLPVLVGVFAVAEILKVAEKNEPLPEIANYKMRGFGVNLAEFKGQIVNWLRSSAIGTFIGILPGLGGGISNILAYTAAKNQSKTPEKFGTGHIDGVVASESANNAVTGGALVPLLTLGLPGDPATAFLLAAFMIHGIVPGPLMFTINLPVVNGILASMLIANILTVVVLYFGMRFFLKVLKVPVQILFPIVLVMCMVGAFSANNRIFDVYTIIWFSLIGYGLTKFNFPSAPFIMGYILGSLLELHLRRSLIITNGSYLAFFERPIAAVIFACAGLFVAYTVYSRYRGRNTLTDG